MSLSLLPLHPRSNRRAISPPQDLPLRTWPVVAAKAAAILLLDEVRKAAAWGALAGVAAPGGHPPSMEPFRTITTTVAVAVRRNARLGPVLRRLLL